MNNIHYTYSCECVNVCMYVCMYIYVCICIYNSKPIQQVNAYINALYTYVHCIDFSVHLHMYHIYLKYTCMYMIL